MENPRHGEIMNIIEKQGSSTVTELSEKLFVCEMTIRRDLAELEKNGLVKRFRGGASSIVKSGLYPIEIRRHFMESEKKELALAASEYITDNSFVFIDSSSVCTYLIPHIGKRKGIRLFTNSIQTMLLAAQLHVPFDLTGGHYYERDMCLVGIEAMKSVSKINPDIAFMSSSALSDDGIISDIDEMQTAVRRIVLKNAAKTVFVFDRTKLHKKHSFTLCSSDEAEAVIHF